MVAPNDESVEYNLLLNAKEALAELQRFNKAAIESSGAVDSLQKRIINFEQVVAAEAKKAGVAFEQQLAAFERLDAKLKSSKKMGVLGSTGGIDPFEATQTQHNKLATTDENYTKGLQERRAASEELVKQNQLLLSQATEIGTKGEEAGNKAAKGAQKAEFATRAWNIAVGMLIHQGINLLINAFQSMFTMAFKGLRELETATYNLVQAERTLSEQGIEITPKGLDESIKKLQELDPLLSKIQATEAVSRVSSLVAPAVGFNAKEIDQLTQSIAVLAVKNKGLGKSFEEVESQVSNAFLSGRVSVGINQLGVKITDQIVKDEALRMQLVKNGDEYDKLTGKMQANIKARAMLSVLSASTSKDVAHLPEFFKTADAQFTIFQSKMQNFFTSLGTAAEPMLMKIFSFLADGFQKATDWADKNRDSLTLWFDVLGNVVVITAKVVGFLLKIGTAFGYIGIMVGKATEKLQAFIDKTPWIKKIADSLGFKGIGDAADTPTGSPSQTSLDAEQVTAQKREKMLKEQEDKLTEIFKDARDKRADIERNYQEKLQDIALNYAQKLEDIARKTAEKVADAQRDYAEKVADINRDAEKKKQDAIIEAHKKEVDLEKQYQDELEKLRQKYLMDLEDALHERDARQILRLMRQYQIDKENLKKKKEADQQQAKEDLAQKLQDIENERKLKLEQAKRDLEEKLRDIRIAAARERQEAALARQRQLNDAQIAHRRAIEEQRIFLQRKLRDLADALKAEYGMTSTALSNLSKLYSKYYQNISALGNSSSPSSVNAGTYTPPASQQYTSSTPIVSPTWGQSGMYGTTGMAEGGTFLATRPATINVGENRPEMITATPLGKPGRDVSKVFANGGLGGLGGGQIEIAMTLSPDLEARVIRNTLDETANIVTRINRSKS